MNRVAHDAGAAPENAIRLAQFDTAIAAQKVQPALTQAIEPVRLRGSIERGTLLLRQPGPGERHRAVGMILILILILILI
jgi:hypothetical protein